MRNALFPLAMLALCACSSHETGPASGPVTTAAARTAISVGDHAFQPTINAADFIAHVRTLSSDAFAGRGPGSPGEAKTIDYIQS
ncbi:MAG TPA: hypothetical protein PLN74_08585, partial [Thermomonas sp.]|nr:hypothetical protein [Thermomonas sp.]